MMVLSGGDIPDDPGEEVRERVWLRGRRGKAKSAPENSSGYCNKEVDRVLETAIRPKMQNSAMSFTSKAIHGYFTTTW